MLEKEVNNGYTQVKIDCIQDGKEYMRVVAKEQSWVENVVEEEDDVEEGEQIPKDEG